MTERIKGDNLPHIPVLYHEVIRALKPRQAGFYVDGTLGAGGHAYGILEASSPDGRLLGLDVDPAALALARERLAIFADRVTYAQTSYHLLREQLERLGWSNVDGIVLDLGLSSMQIGSPERGFSFQIDAPLDMRFNQQNELTAADLVNRLSEQNLAEVLYEYGEEPQGRQIARVIIAARPVRTTKQLADIVEGVVSKKTTTKSRQSRKIHPATRTFQALRIAVNKELDVLEASLPETMQALSTGGRLAIISYHSLEDRVVKRFYRRESRDCICPPKQPVCTCGHQAQLVEITRKPILPGPDEIMLNPRSRSAKLRVAEKI